MFSEHFTTNSGLGAWLFSRPAKQYDSFTLCLLLDATSMFELSKNKEPADNLEKPTKRFRRRCLIIAFAALAWFGVGILLVNAGVDVSKATGILGILFWLYLVTFMCSPLVALVAFLFAAYSRRWIETQAETRRIREEQRSRETFRTDWQLESHTSKVRNSIKNVMRRSRGEKLHCQKCGVELKRRSELQGQKIGGVVLGSEMQNFLDSMLTCAYRCRNCGYLKCQSCVRVGGGCPSCTQLIFDAVD